MVNTLIGTFIRERRIALGLKQGNFAKLVGISPSYLNLIEHNRRRVSPDLLKIMASTLGTDIIHLLQDSVGDLLDDLRLAAATAQNVQVELNQIEDFVARFPGWARFTAATQVRMQQLEHMILALNERLTHDPYLTEAFHDLLSVVTSIRSTATILAEDIDVTPEWRSRFHENLHQDSQRLALGVETLANYLGGDISSKENKAPQNSDPSSPNLGTSDQELSVFVAPQHELESWLNARHWQLEELESPEGQQELIAEIDGFASISVRRYAQRFITQAIEEANLLPMSTLQHHLAAGVKDPALIARACKVPVMVVMRRLAFVPGAEIGLVSCDSSGALSLRKPIDGFSAPSFGSACTLWPLFTALGNPTTPIIAVLQTSGRNPRAFRSLSMAHSYLPQGFNGPTLREAVMLVFPMSMEELKEEGTDTLTVGATCRVCFRQNCPARREPSLSGEAF